MRTNTAPIYNRIFATPQISNICPSFHQHWTGCVFGQDRYIPYGTCSAQSTYYVPHLHFIQRRIHGLKSGGQRGRAPKARDSRRRGGWREEEACPLPRRLGVWGSVVSSIRGVRGQSPGRQRFWYYLGVKKTTLVSTNLSYYDLLFVVNLSVFHLLNSRVDSSSVPSRRIQT